MAEDSGGSGENSEIERGWERQDSCGFTAGDAKVAKFGTLRVTIARLWCCAVAARAPPTDDHTKSNSMATFQPTVSRIERRASLVHDAHPLYVATSTSGLNNLLQCRTAANH